MSLGGNKWHRHLISARLFSALSSSAARNGSLAAALGASRRRHRSRQLWRRSRPKRIGSAAWPRLGGGNMFGGIKRSARMASAAGARVGLAAAAAQRGISSSRHLAASAAQRISAANNIGIGARHQRIAAASRRHLGGGIGVVGAAAKAAALGGAAASALISASLISSASAASAAAHRGGIA